jgi:hypothetical protein
VARGAPVGAGEDAVELGVGEKRAGLVGGLLVTSLGLAAYSRADLLEAERRPF